MTEAIKGEEFCASDHIVVVGEATANPRRHCKDHDKLMLETEVASLDPMKQRIV